MNLQLCEAVMPKCVNYCPRCKEMMRRIEALFNGPSTTRRSDLCELFSCPPCTDIVRKFREFARDTSIREHDSALIHLQRLTAPQDDLEFKIRSIFNKAGLFKTAGGLKDRDGKIIYKDVCFKDEDGSLQDKEGIYKCRRVSFKDVDGSSKDEEGVDKDEGKGKMKFNDENVKDKEEISKDTGKRFKDINESVKDKDGISNNTGNSCKDKDDSVKDREEIRIDRGKVPSGADRLTENLEGKTHGREAKTSKTSNIKDTMGNEKGRHGTQGRQTETETSKTSNLKGTTGKLKEKHDTQGKETEKSKTNNLKETTEKAKGRQDAPAREVETLKTNNLKATTEKAKGRHEAPAREVETLKTNNLKEIPGKAKGRYDTQGREVETSKTNNLKETTGKAKGRHDAPAREASKTNDLKGNAKAKEKQDTQRRNAETSKTNNSKEQTGKAKGTEAGSSKTKENDEINKDVKLRKSIDEGSKATKTKDTNKTAGSNITKEESKLGKRGGIQNNASDSRIMANELAASKSKKGLSSKAKSMVQLGDQKNRSLEISSGLMRMKIEEHMREIQHEKEETGKTRQAQKPTKVERQARTSAEKARQLSFNETLQLFAPRDEESVDRAGDVLECPQYEEGQEVIRGNRVYKISKREAVKQEKVESAIELQPVKSWRPPSRSRPVSVDKTMVQSSASIGDGVLRYSLSEPKYINRGWTLLPKEMIMRKVRVYLMHPARQNYDWLEMNKHRKLLVYSSGEPLATFEENKTRLYYKSGEVALELYRAEDTNGDRVVVYSTGKPAAGLAQPRTVLAVFDYSGNGAVYDHAGQIR
ncbi:microtubule-associated protein futsch-like isoform X2 [Cydia pomonella]|uniref:microtubule-associated protein futsch-like isoform X2 n=1 Tax=Cydia pomonella TaxID=82600 RepID=UPI002ADD8471|nr:microtubule-associated protein futsch-like isoform X2 [Cydia pomonella]